MSDSSGVLGKLMWPALGLTVVLAVMVYGCVYLDWERERTPDVLVEIALTGGTPEERQLAAAELADHGEAAKTHLRRLLTESTEPGVRAAAIEGLGRIPDYDSMDQLLAALDDESLVVRGRAAKQVRDMLGRAFPYDANAPPEKRKKMNEAMRKEWESVKGTELFNNYIERRKREAGKPKTINIRNQQNAPSGGEDG